MVKNIKKNRDPSVIKLENLVEKNIYVKFQGGREISGIMKGSDQVNNIVMDNVIEYLKDPNDPSILSGKTRKLGLTVARGTSILVINPEDGMESISNPFTLEDATE